MDLKAIMKKLSQLLSSVKAPQDVPWLERARGPHQHLPPVSGSSPLPRPAVPCKHHSETWVMLL